MGIMCGNLEGRGEKGRLTSADRAKRGRPTAKPSGSSAELTGAEDGDNPGRIDPD